MNFFELLTKISSIKKQFNKKDKESLENVKQQIGELKNTLPTEIDSQVYLILETIQNGVNATSIEQPAQAAFYDKFFKPEVYQELLEYMQLAYHFEKNGIPEEHALKLTVLFGDTATALKYIQQSLCSVHDACLFQLPNVANCHFNQWQKYAKKYMHEPRFRKLLPLAEEIESILYPPHIAKPNLQAIYQKKKDISAKHHQWKKFKKNHGNLTHDEKILYQQLSQDLLQLNEELVALCVNIPFANVDLIILHACYEHLIKISNPEYKYFLENGLTSKDYNKFLSLNRFDAGKNIPDLTLDGKNIGHPGFYVTKVPVEKLDHAVRAACLGKLTNCCQSLSGEAGESCTVHGLSSPNGGFYVLCQGDAKAPQASDPLFAQCWVWRSQSGALIFDSIEVSPKVNSAKFQSMVVRFYQKFGKALATGGYTTRVQCGHQSGISALVGIEGITQQRELFVDYSGYTDSDQQLVVYDAQHPYYRYDKEPDAATTTTQEVLKIMESSVPLVKSKFLMNALNWGLLNRSTFLLEKLVKLATKVGRQYELETHMHSMKNYIDNGLPLEDIISRVRGQQFYPECVNHKGKTALMLAAYEASAESIEVLISNGSNIHAKDNQGNNILDYAIKGGDKSIVQKFLEMGIDVQEKNGNGDLPLHCAIQSDQNEIVEMLIEKGANIHARNDAENTSLIMAVIKLDKSLIQKLLKRSADIQAKNCLGQTALMEAVLQGDPDIVITLLDHGADVNIIDNTGKNALMLLIANTEINDEDSCKILENLIAHGSQLNLKDNEGKTALFLALERNSPQFAMPLIKNGADVHTKGNAEITTLMWAAYHKMHEVTNILLEKGVDYNAIGNGFTVLQWAIHGKNKRFINLLLSKEVNLDAQNHAGKTALMTAVELRYSDTIALLLEKNVDLEVKDKQGKTALMLAQERQLTHIVHQIEEKIFEMSKQPIPALIFSDRSSEPEKENILKTDGFSGRCQTPELPESIRNT